eukprot:Nk52_evm35s293 gene=Nk52_evmTU35s293
MRGIRVGIRCIFPLMQKGSVNGGRGGMAARRSLVTRARGEGKGLGGGRLGVGGTPLVSMGRSSPQGHIIGDLALPPRKPGQLLSTCSSATFSSGRKGNDGEEEEEEERIGKGVNSSSSGTGVSNGKSGADPLSAKGLVGEELLRISEGIKKSLNSEHERLNLSANYYFDSKGKNFRPLVVLLTSKACSYTLSDPAKHRHVTEGQLTLAMIAEMIHTASLVHDDVIDEADSRRNKPSVNSVFGDAQSILSGDYILAKASIELARLGNCQVVDIMAGIINDLVQGELMQLGSVDDDNTDMEAQREARFEHYLKKTYLKTASLLARSSRAAAVLNGYPDEIVENCFQYGKNIGIAFQLIDDLLDFVSTSDDMGKPTAADLSLGLATAPLLYASEEFPDELFPLIKRRFSGKGDVETAFNLVHKSEGLKKTKVLAMEYCQKAVENISQLPTSNEQLCLIKLTDSVINRIK